MAQNGELSWITIKILPEKIIYLKVIEFVLQIIMDLKRHINSVDQTNDNTIGEAKRKRFSSVETAKEFFQCSLCNRLFTEGKFILSKLKFIKI